MTSNKIETPLATTLTTRFGLHGVCVAGLVAAAGRVLICYGGRVDDKGRRWGCSLLYIRNERRCSCKCAATRPTPQRSSSTHFRRLVLFFGAERWICVVSRTSDTRGAKSTSRRIRTCAHEWTGALILRLRSSYMIHIMNPLGQRCS